MEKMQFHPHPKQMEVLNTKARFQAWACGRRWGKTLLASYIVCENSLIPKNKIWIVAPSYDLVRRCWEMIYGHYIRELKPFLRSINNTSGNLKIETIFDSTIEGKSADRPESLIGTGLDLVVIDEASRVKEVAWKQALRPTLIDSQGRMIAVSTPRGMNWFHDLYVKGQAGKKDYASFKFPSHTNPYINPEELESIAADMPQVMYRQEILAEFIEDAGQVFRKIYEAIKGGLEEPQEGIEYVGGVDPAKYNDFTVIQIARKDNNHIVYKDRFNDIDWTLIKDRITNASKKYNNATMWLDSTGVGDPIFDDLDKEGVNVESYKFTNESKINLISNLSLMLENNEITYPQDENLLNELKIYSYERLPSGKYRYQAPEGLHDDDVTALMLCAWGLNNKLEPNIHFI